MWRGPQWPPAAAPGPSPELGNGGFSPGAGTWQIATVLTLRLAGLPTVDDDTFAEATPATRERRRMLAAFLRNDGWPIDERQSHP